MSIPIHNASQNGLNTATLPQMRDALANWYQPLTFISVSKSVVNFDVQEVQTPTDFQGVVVPMPPRRLQLKPEGQRKWRWQLLFTTPDVQINPDDIVNYNGVTYRVMSRSDWSAYDYCEYEIMEDYGNSG